MSENHALPEEENIETRGRKRYYEEKKGRVNMTLTDLATRRLDEKATELGLTRSELVERLARLALPKMTEAQILGKSRIR